MLHQAPQEAPAVTANTEGANNVHALVLEHEAVGALYHCNIAALNSLCERTWSVTREGCEVKHKPDSAANPCVAPCPLMQGR